MMKCIIVWISLKDVGMFKNHWLTTFFPCFYTTKIRTGRIIVNCDVDFNLTEEVWEVFESDIRKEDDVPDNAIILSITKIE